MPLLPGKANVGKNIRELQQPSENAPHGRSRKQAIAIALDHLRRTGGHQEGAYSRAYRERHGSVR